MQIITSAQNSRFKDILKLATKQSYRTKQQMTILEGIHLAEEWLQTYGAPELCIIRDEFKPGAETAELINRCEDLEVELLALSDNLYRKISPVEHSAGVMLVIKTPKSTAIDPLADMLLLENVQDPGNLGTILRSAAASGVEQIVCSSGTAAAWSPKVLRAAMGAHFRLRIFENQDLAAVISALKIPVYATSLEATESIYDQDLVAPTAWIFGNEGAGVTPEIQKLATKQIIIPQASSVESLNVAMATTVCLFEQHRQRIAK